ncbi:MAG: hypothetical protein ACI92E_001807 [Oceanicoccus sp.]|jgi:hypothetical protein
MVPISPKRILLWMLTIALSQAATMSYSDSVLSQAVKVEIVAQDGKYQLLRGGKPYVVKGAGINSLDLQSVAAHGGNSVRTWAVDDGLEPALQLLDRAHALDLTVSLCLDIARERHGFDYNDPVAVELQAEQARSHIIKYRDHPALLTWIVGNELNFDFTNPKVYDAVNDISKMIHELDPNHPTTTTLAGFDERALQVIEERATDLDFLSFQIYGDLINLPKHIKRTGFDGPYFITEWGAVGHWEVDKTSWGAPIEDTSSEKANNYSKSYLQVLEPFADQAIGNYVFLWGQKQEKTPTWYGLFLGSGEETEVVDVLHHFWNGRWPDNRSPKVGPIQLDQKTAFEDVILNSGMKYLATIAVEDPDNDPMRYRWEIRAESSSLHVGGDHEEPPDIIHGLIENPSVAEIILNTPQTSGAYRLFVYVFDDHNHAAHANIPFYVR